ncbi:MAG: C25 family peptidase propeptide domain-containing protein, partial [Candidatus Cloacimonadota bacterium]|nr:C25 family peptidase propeptide domain-containing protein [Candidatus Cloacimonadota bacterium]
MKKGLILFLFLISSILIADWHDFGKENDSMFNVAVANEYETELEFNLDGFNLEKIEDNKEIYWAISYPGEGEFMQVGMPGLPRFSRLIAIPANADVELEILGKSEEIFESIKVFPQQQLQSESKKETHEFVINSSFYDGNETFPNNIAELGEPAILRDLRVITLTINPFSYDAGTNELNVIHNLKLKVTTKGNSNKNVKLSQRPISRFFEPLYESAVLNYSSVDRSEYQQPSYLFIYPDNAAVENSLQMLLD